MEYDIIKMTATASVGGAYTKGQIFDDSGSQIRLYLIDGVAYVNFEGIGVLWLVGIDLRLKKTPQKKILQNQIARSRPVHVAFARNGPINDQSTAIENSDLLLDKRADNMAYVAGFVAFTTMLCTAVVFHATSWRMRETTAATTLTQMAKSIPVRPAYSGRLIRAYTTKTISA